MDRAKYILPKEKEIITKSIKEQITLLKSELQDNSNFHIKHDIDRVTLMREGE